MISARRMHASGASWPSVRHEERRAEPEADGLVCCKQCGAAMIDTETGAYEGAAGRADFHTRSDAHDPRLECDCDSGTDLDSPG